MRPRGLAALALSAPLLTGCTVPRPAGDGTLRYFAMDLASAQHR